MLSKKLITLIANGGIITFISFTIQKELQNITENIKENVYKAN